MDQARGRAAERVKPSASTAALTSRDEQGISALRQVLAGLESPLTPQTVLGVARTDSLLRQMREEFGFLSEAEVMALLGQNQDHSYVVIPRSNAIIGFVYGDDYVYPGFQFDKRLLSVRTIVPQLVALVTEHRRSSLGLACWLCSPSGYLDGARPVDLLDDPLRVLSAARGHYGAVW